MNQKRLSIFYIKSNGNKTIWRCDINDQKGYKSFLLNSYGEYTSSCNHDLNKDVCHQGMRLCVCVAGGGGGGTVKLLTDIKFVINKFLHTSPKPFPIFYPKIHWKNISCFSWRVSHMMQKTGPVCQISYCLNHLQEDYIHNSFVIGVVILREKEQRKEGRRERRNERRKEGEKKRRKIKRVGSKILKLWISRSNIRLVDLLTNPCLLSFLPSHILL